MRILCFVLTVLFLLTGCGKRAQDPNVVSVQGTDERMNAAMAKARQTVDEFVAALNNPKSNQSGFAVKKRFESGGQIEHMWINHLSFDGTHFHGTLNNQPRSIKNVEHGDRVTVAKHEISDWMYLEDGRLRGGFTIRAIRDGMTPKEREEFDRSSSMVFD
jgi:uncharacterized protein YegJ (DUF2314 family)